MTKKELHDAIYLANTTVLLFHQIEAAFWHEWSMFRIPGGVQANVIVNIPIVLLLLWGVRALAKEQPAGRIVSWIVVCCGVLAVVIHTGFFLRGYSEFTLPVSFALMAATLLLSLFQGILLLRLSKETAAVS